MLPRDMFIADGDIAAVDNPSPAWRERVAPGGARRRVRAGVLRPSPSHGFAAGPSLSRVAGEGIVERGR